MSSSASSLNKICTPVPSSARGNITDFVQKHKNPHGGTWGTRQAKRQGSRKQESHSLGIGIVYWAHSTDSFAEVPCCSHGRAEIERCSHSPQVPVIIRSTWKE
ncbi:hypothetical protein VTO42DRAFT_653 [Malbranchea cinnamomea]